MTENDELKRCPDMDALETLLNYFRQLKQEIDAQKQNSSEQSTSEYDEAPTLVSDSNDKEGIENFVKSQENPEPIGCKV